mgnify:CR=1 FL=1
MKKIMRSAAGLLTAMVVSVCGLMGYYSVKLPDSYYVKKGETLSHIAVNYSTTVSKLCALNGIKPNSLLQIKQKLRVK